MNNYQSTLPMEEFLKITYKLMLLKVQRLKEIQKSMVRGKLPLPLLQ